VILLQLKVYVFAKITVAHHDCIKLAANPKIYLEVKIMIEENFNHDITLFMLPQFVH